MTAAAEQPKVRSQKRQRPVVASTRFSDAEYDRVRQAAAQQGRSVSDYLRAIALRPA